MTDFTRLFELIDEAVRGAECECRTTAMAYLRMATSEWYRLAYELTDDAKRARFMRAAQYADRKTLAEPSLQKAVDFVEAFWNGFENGWEGHTQPSKAGNAFKIGRKYATSADP